MSLPKQGDRVSATINIKGWRSSIGGLSVTSSRSIDLDAPNGLDMKIAARDLELLLQVMQRNPDEFAEIIRSATSGNLSRAVSAANRIGVTEAEFANADGGFMQAVFVAVVIAAVLVQDGHDKAGDEEVPLFEDIEDIVEPK